MSKMPDDYQIPDYPEAMQMDAAFLRTLSGIQDIPGEDPPELPIEVRRAHYDMSRALSILGVRGASMDPTQLAFVHCLALRSNERVKLPPAKPKQKRGPSFLDETIELGELVMIRWRHQDRLAQFVRFENDKVVVLYEDNERNIRPDLVRRPTEEEMPSVAEVS